MDSQKKLPFESYVEGSCLAGLQQEIADGENSNENDNLHLNFSSCSFAGFLSVAGEICSVC